MFGHDIGQMFKRNGIFVFAIVLELACFAFSLTAVEPLVRAAFAFPSLFIVPGLVLPVALGNQDEMNLVELVVKGFFISTGLLVLTTSAMLFIGIALSPVTYSSTALIIVTAASLIGVARQRSLKSNSSNLALVAVAFLCFLIILSIFSQLPRLFAPDETSYIYSAIRGILNGTVPPFGVRPDRNELVALLQGRYYWIYLLASFIASTGLPAEYAGLLGVSFVVMTALASSLLVEGRWLRMVVFAAVALNPLAFSFAGMALNDLAVAFFAVFATTFFVRSFSKAENSVSISIANLVVAVLGLIVLSLVKFTLLIGAAMWLVLVYALLRYKLYHKNRTYQVLLITALLPILAYEICIDIPYVVSAWVLRIPELAGFFAQFLFFSPFERVVGWFWAPWWEPGAQTIFSGNPARALDYFYRFLNPESYSLLLCGVVLSLPVLLLSKEMRKEFRSVLLASLLLLSMALYYLDALGTLIPSDVGRLSLWIVPIMIPLAVLVLRSITASPSFRNAFPALLASLLFLLLNVALTGLYGNGVGIGYALGSNLLTTSLVAAQLASLAIIVIFLLLAQRRNLSKVRIQWYRPFFARTVDIKKAVFCSFSIMILLNASYFAAAFVQGSLLYRDHGSAAASDALDGFVGANSLVFANNYIYMRTYARTGILRNGLLLPAPDTLDDLYRLLQTAPNDTYLLISDDSDTAWYEYANDYIKPYARLEAITSQGATVTELPKLNLTDPLLVMPFDDANVTTIPDHSGLNHDGVNHGAAIAPGYYGSALRFNGSTYVGVPSFQTASHKCVTVSFFALIEEAEPSTGYMILSKGYAEATGSYDVFVWDRRLFFELGGVGTLSVPAIAYVGAWHQFIFTYDGEGMAIYVDGTPVVARMAAGFFRNSTYELEIGRDSERYGYYFVGELDELQISETPLNASEIVPLFFSDYALRVQRIVLPEGEAGLFRIVNNASSGNGTLSVQGARIDLNADVSIAIALQIESLALANATVLIGTDRFTKVCAVPLELGSNEIEFRFYYETYPPLGRYYWPHLGQVRLIVIDNGKISYATYLATQDSRLMNAYLGLLVLGVVGALLVVELRQSSWWSRASRRIPSNTRTDSKAEPGLEIPTMPVVVYSRE